jgi:hypothetical protein
MTATSDLVTGAIEAWETRRKGLPPKKQVKLNINVGNQHLLDAIRAEAEVRNMSVNSFMRSMIKGYFGAALHGR